MRRDSENEARHYLLGRLSEEEAQQLERAYFADPACVDDVAAAESDLVDAYVAGSLAPADRQAFESHYLASPVHRDRVQTARLLHRAAGRPGSRRVPPVWVGLLAAAAVLAGVVFWPPRQADRPTATQVASAPSPTPAETASSAPAPTATAVPAVPKRGVTLALAAVRVRGETGTPELRVTADVDEIALELGRPADAPAGGRLSFVVRTIEGAEVASGRLERRAGTLGVARLGAARLGPDDYIVAVSSTDEPALAQYFFRVVR